MNTEQIMLEHSELIREVKGLIQSTSDLKSKRLLIGLQDRLLRSETMISKLGKIDTLMAELKEIKESLKT